MVKWWMNALVVVLGAGCADLQRATERPDDRAAREAAERQERERPAKEAKAKQDREQARKDYLDKRDAAVKAVTETAEFTDIVNAPQKLAGKIVRTSARWHDVSGDVAYVDSFGGAGSVMVEVIPPLKLTPKAYFAMEFADWQERQVFFEGLKHAQVNLVVSVLDGPSGPQQPCIARILDAQAK